MTSASTVSIVVNGEAQAWPQGTTIADLVASMALAGKRFAVECNQEIVPRAEHAGTPLRTGDQVEIVQAIGGG